MKLKLYIILVITLLSSIVRANAETITLPYMYVTNGENIYLSSGGGQITFDVTFTSTIQIGYEDIYVEQMNDYLDNKGGSDMIRVISLSVSGTVTVEVFPNTSTTDISFNISGTSGAKSVLVTLAGATPPPDPEPTEPKFNISGNWILGKTYTKSDGSNFQDITFYNGLGYPEQIINIGASSINKKNIVTPVTYDYLLRNDAKTYLPFVSANNTLASETNPTSLQQTFYTNLYGSSNGQYAYVEKVYEPSVLNRVLQEYNAGSIFRTQSKKSVYTYETNTSSEVFKFDVSSTNSLTVSYYGAGVLYKNSITNEDGTVSYSFTDKSGRKVLDRTIGESSVNYNTYYAYDDFGRLAWVISPEGSSSLSTGTISTTSAIATKYSYIYTYDGKGNVIEKRIPAKGVEYYVYDKGNRLVMSQDARLRTTNDWIYYVYDNQNRVIDKSVVRGTITRQALQDKYNGAYFDNGYPQLGGSDNSYKPFDTHDFTIVSPLESIRYKNNVYRTSLTEQTYTLAMSGTYLKVYTDMIVNWGAYYYDIHNFYINTDDNIKDLYYICTDSNDATIKYYYIPTAFMDIVDNIYWADPNMAYEVISTYPGSGTPLASINITSWVPPTSRDTYTLDSEFAIPSTLSFAEVPNVATSSENDQLTNHNLKAYEKIGILSDGNSITGYVERAFYYDYLGRVIQTVEKNHLGGISRISTKYNLIGNILAQQESHQPGSGLPADTRLANFTYDERSRILTETTTINGGTTGTISYSYNELGQLIGKTYGNGVSESLNYNIQGWLSNKSASRSGSNVFNMTLRYYDATKGTSRFTGDITEWQWTQGSNPANIYSFSYDKLSRLTNSNLYVNDVAQNAFTEKNLTYDLNGNINQLQRYGSTSTLQDNFTYAYNGNTLTGITGSVSASYSYDGNGNMSSDGRKNLAISYNLLNLQQSLSQSGTTVSTYTWLSDGTKCAVVDNTTNGYDYLGSLIYSRSGSTRTFESAEFGGGRIIYSSGTYSPYYYITDHLGSTRVITDYSGNVQERNDYYPFGGKHANASYPQLTVNRQKFNGKELQTTGNTNFIDYGARMYDDVIGRWGVVDPLAEKYASLSGYNYGLNNPVRMIDKDGRRSAEFGDNDKKKNDAETSWFQQAIATTLFSIINTAKLYGDNHSGKQTETEKLAAGFNLFTGAVLSVQGGMEMSKPSSSMSKSDKLAGYSDDAVSAGKVTQNAVGVAKKGSQTVYRVFGGEAKALGKSWTPVNPGSVAKYRDAAGLPNVNTGQFIIEGTVKNSNILLQRSALSANGNAGGIMEYVIKDPTKIKINGVWGVNPPF